MHLPVVTAPSSQPPAPAGCPALSKAKHGPPVPKQGASSSDSAPKIPAVDKAKPASPTSAAPKLIAKEKARPPPLVPEKTETQDEPPLPAPAAPPTEPAPPKASFPPVTGEARQPEVPRAPSLAAEAPASRVGSVINDADGNPLFCLVQLWACRKRCETCENAFCQATFADRTSAYHARHRCRDCKRAKGRAAAHQQSSWPSQSWESSPAWYSWQEGENWGQPVGSESPLGAPPHPVFSLYFAHWCRQGLSTPAENAFSARVPFAQGMPRFGWFRSRTICMHAARSASAHSASGAASGFALPLAGLLLLVDNTAPSAPPGVLDVAHSVALHTFPICTCPLLRSCQRSSFSSLRTPTYQRR